MELDKDFKGFLVLLNQQEVEYLVIGGYAVAFHLGSPPVRIDIMTRISGTKFLDCYPRRMEMEIEGIKIYYISLQDLIDNKKASGRQKDLGDLEHLH